MRIRSQEESSERAYTRRGSGAALSVPDRRDQPVAQCRCDRDVGTTLCASPHGYRGADEKPGCHAGLRYRRRADPARAAGRAGRAAWQRHRLRGRGTAVTHACRPDRGRPAGSRPETGVARQRQRPGAVARLRAAVPDTAQEHAAAAGAAPRRHAAGAVATAGGRPGAGRRGRAAVSIGRRSAPAGDPDRRHPRHRGGAVPRRPRTGGADRPVPLGRGRCLALWPCQRQPARARQRDPGGRLRPRADGAAAAHAGAHGPARGLAADAGRRRAESFPDQHPAAGGDAARRIFRGQRCGRSRRSRRWCARA